MDWLGYRNWSRLNQCSFEELYIEMGTERLFLAGALGSIAKRSSFDVFGESFHLFHLGTGECFLFQFGWIVVRGDLLLDVA